MPKDDGIGRDIHIDRLSGAEVTATVTDLASRCLHGHHAQAGCTLAQLPRPEDQAAEPTRNRNDQLLSGSQYCRASALRTARRSGKSDRTGHARATHAQAYGTNPGPWVI